MQTMTFYAQRVLTLSAHLNTCKSIDPTFSPSYEVVVSQLDVTYPAKVAITQVDSKAFPGPVTSTVERDVRKLALKSNGAGQVKFQDGKLSVAKLGNGILKGSLKFDSGRNIELSCNQ